MKERFRKYLSSCSVSEKDKSVLLALSGGIDSMVMMDLFAKEKIRIVIAHCNFALRGQESDGDEDFVKKYAQKHKIPFRSVRFDTKQYAEKNGLSIQMAARELRYSWFEETRIKENCDFTAVAHNLNDNIETLLINLTRGTGLSGLTGMKQVNGSIIRPLLFATRSEIEEYSKSHRIQYREDRSNADTKYTRNKLRHKVIPVLKDINPSFETAIAETIKRLGETDKLLEQYIKSARSELISNDSIDIRIDCKKLNQLTDNETLIFELFRIYGLRGNQVKDLINIIKGKTGKQLNTESHRILKNRASIIVIPISAENEESYIITDLNELTKLQFIKSCRSVRPGKNFIIPGDTGTACLDEASLVFPLKIRKWEKGDYFYPFGMTGRKKVSDFLTDTKLSLIEKDKVRILESDGKIVWIIGKRIDNRFRIKPETKKILIIQT